MFNWLRNVYLIYEQWNEHTIINNQYQPTSATKQRESTAIQWCPNARSNTRSVGWEDGCQSVLQGGALVFEEGRSGGWWRSGGAEVWKCGSARKVRYIRHHTFEPLSSIVFEKTRCYWTCHNARTVITYIISNKIEVGCWYCTLTKWQNTYEAQLCNGLLLFFVRVQRPRSDIQGATVSSGHHLIFTSLLFVFIRTDYIINQLHLVFSIILTEYRMSRSIQASPSLDILLRHPCPGFVLLGSISVRQQVACSACASDATSLGGSSFLISYLLFIFDFDRKPSHSWCLTFQEYGFLPLDTLFWSDIYLVLS